MSNFDIEVSETLARTISIEADSVDEAIAKVSQMYRNEQIVLDSEDFIDVSVRRHDGK